MPYAVAAKNVMLDQLGTVAVYLSVHDANPGSTGTNEASGSVRGAITWNTASGGFKTQSNTPAVTAIPNAFVVRYVGLWSASTGGTYYGYQAVSTTSTVTAGTWTYTATTGQIDLNAVASA